jgi:hypothetical protein
MIRMMADVLCLLAGSGGIAQSGPASLHPTRLNLLPPAGFPPAETLFLAARQCGETSEFGSRGILLRARPRPLPTRPAIDSGLGNRLAADSLRGRRTHAEPLGLPSRSTLANLNGHSVSHGTAASATGSVGLTRGVPGDPTRRRWRFDARPPWVRVCSASESPRSRHLALLVRFPGGRGPPLHWHGRRPPPGPSQQSVRVASRV